MSYPQVLRAAACLDQSFATPTAARLRRAVLAVGLLIVLASPLGAQLPMPRLHQIFPPGGQLGTSVDVTIRGLDLDADTEAAQELVFSHPGITAEQKVTPPRSAESEPQPLPGQFVVTIDGDVPVGTHEVRVRGRYGLSTPRPFSVGNLPEVLEQGGNNSLESPMPLELNSVVNGRTSGDSYDVYRFAASAGQRVLLQCKALRLDSRMDATMTLRDASGEQLAYSHIARRSEPMIDFTAPADGSYLLQVYDSTYRGGEPFFYRLAISTQPHLDFVFPPVGTPGTTGTFTLYGRNLPAATPAEGVAVDGVALQKTEVEIPIPAEPQGSGVPLSGRFLGPSDAGARGFEYRMQTPAGPSNPIFISFATAAVIPEQEPNDDRNRPQPITVPCEVVGQFFASRDRDWFSFQAKRGERFAVEVFSQRRGLPTDPFLLVQHVSTDEQGEPTVRDIAEADDFDPEFANPPFDTPLRDPALVFTADADGTYRVLVRDLYSGTDPDPRHVYSLLVTPPKPDFRLVATFKDFANPDPEKTLAAAPILRPGGTKSSVVQAYRRAGFTGPITITASNLPDGVVCPPVVIPAGQNRATLVLAAAESAPRSTSSIRIVGTALLDGEEVRREAIGSVVVWGKNNANETTDARLISDIPLSVITDPAPLSVAIGGESTRETSRAGKLSFPVQITRREGADGAIELRAQGLPAEIKASPLNLDAEATEGRLELTVEPNAPVGPLSFHLAGQSKVTYRRNPETAKPAADAPAAKEIEVFVESLPVTLHVAADPVTPTAPATAVGGQGR